MPTVSNELGQDSSFPDLGYKIIREQYPSILLSDSNDQRVEKYINQKQINNPFYFILENPVQEESDLIEFLNQTFELSKL